ncbi:hypothetical protein BC835DRAFT_1387862 [Cytidiella melzeri]|nr:hypothetical protein BC835DRAFT_1387862 [Cytidiella melzeri]
MMANKWPDNYTFSNKTRYMIADVPNALLISSTPVLVRFSLAEHLSHVLVVSGVPLAYISPLDKPTKYCAHDN